MLARPLVAAMKVRIPNHVFATSQSRLISSYPSSRTATSAGVFGAVAGAGMLGLVSFPDFTTEEKMPEMCTPPIPIEKKYTLEEMNALCVAGRIVVAHKGSLFDITEFTGPPGDGGSLQMAAGCDLEVYWKAHNQHNVDHDVDKTMAPYKIGEVSTEDMQIITARSRYPHTMKSVERSLVGRFSRRFTSGFRNLEKPAEAEHRIKNQGS